VRRGTDLRSKQIIISSILIILPSIAVYNFHAAESQMLQARVFYSPNDVTKKDSFYMSSKSVINNPFTEPYYKYQVATFLITNGFDTEGFKLLNEMIMKEPTNLDYLNSRAGFYEQLGKYQLAITDRKVIESMDPWNARNYLIMGLDYKYLGDLANMKRSLDKIVKFNKVDDVFKEALKVLVE
jgi:tetratricopeptide (TPR) repeat protein